MIPASNTNLTPPRPTFVTHLECGLVGDHYPADTLHGLSVAGRPLLVRYDLDAIAAAVTRDDMATGARRGMGGGRRDGAVIHLRDWAQISVTASGSVARPACAD